MKNRYSRNVTFMFRRKSPARRLCCCQHLNAGSHIDNLCIYLFCHFEVWLPARFLAFHQQSNPNTPVFLWRRWGSNSRPFACKANVLTNWTTTPLDTRVGFEPTNNSFADCSLNRLGNGWMLLRKVKDSNLRYISVCHVSNVVLSVTQPTFLFVAVVEPASHLWVMSPPCDYHTATAILKSLLPFASFRLVY